MKNYHKQTLAVMIIGFYLALYLHDTNLYPQLNTLDTAILSFLRFFLIAAPIVTGFLIVRFKDKKPLKILLLILWLLLIPYTIYSVTEIRHVSELCRLTESSIYYTEICATQVWTLFPTFLYAAFGSLGFVFSVSQVISNLIPVSWKKQLVIILLCLYGGFSSVFGIYSRVNVWEIFSNPANVVRNLTVTVSQTSFVTNFLIFSFFVVLYFFVTNRLLRQVDNHIS